jgi:hypothetical protein
MTDITLPEDWHIIYELAKIFQDAVFVGGLCDFLTINKDKTSKWKIKDIDLRITKKDFISFYFLNAKNFDRNKFKINNFEFKLIGSLPHMIMYRGSYKSKTVDLFIVNDDYIVHQMIHALKVETLNSRIDIVKEWKRKKSFLHKCNYLL